MGDVKTVLLLSHQPLEKITTVHLDFDSRTSVTLVRVLAQDFWKISPKWIDLPPGSASAPGEIESLVAIGDKTFTLASQFPYVYDLAGEWKKHTGMPFVFAAWVANRDLPEGFLRKFNNALAYGIGHIPEVPDFFRNQMPKGVDSIAYFLEQMGLQATPEQMQQLLTEVKERSLKEKRLVSLAEFQQMLAAMS